MYDLEWYDGIVDRRMDGVELYVVSLLLASLSNIMILFVLLLDY